ncbi:MAG: type IV pili twitching motility protein PilT [Elusimicrobia bacterium RBG_16_66_12]|nr:MAG: type IV pili twitching motility protein PilT [Elusimicrobia bacterium RBG_16_66_12]
MAELIEVLKAVAQSGASDLHLAVGKPPMARLHGKIVPLPGLSALSAEECERMVYSVLSEAQRARFEERWELDGSVSIPGSSRFRLNVFRQKNGLGAVFRAIPAKIPTAAEIGLMPAVANLVDLPRGLVLVTGPTGSGKSTTLACLIESINVKHNAHVLTIEDPIEFVYDDKSSIVLQREVGTSTKSFAEALRHSMRQDPDVILIGEMRDLETIQLALTAAETGHLCFGTLHTQDAPSTIDRIIDVFPANQQAQVRLQVSTVLQAVVCQQLLPRKGGGRVCAREFMRVTSGIANLIREGKTHQIYGAMEAGAKHGMISMDQYLAFLIRQNLVEPDDAYAVAHDAGTVRQLASIAPAAAPQNA